MYRGRLAPTRDPVAFATYVAFFPQLVAGPIVRATRLLPQIERARRLSALEIRTGWRLICWGVFKKVVIADTAALYANAAFGDAGWTGPAMVLGVLAFALQIYGDFSGYSDIAIGTARLSASASAPISALFLPRPGRVLRRCTSRSTRGSAITSTSCSGPASATADAAQRGDRVPREWPVVRRRLKPWRGAIHAAFFVPLFVLGCNRRPEAGWRSAWPRGRCGRSRWSVRVGLSAPMTAPRADRSPGWAGCSEVLPKSPIQDWAWFAAILSVFLARMAPVPPGYCWMWRGCGGIRGWRRRCCWRPWSRDAPGGSGIHHFAF